MCTNPKQVSLIQNGILSSINPDSWTPPCTKGSLYKDSIRKIRLGLEKNGDWDWLHDLKTGDVLKAGQIEPLAKRFAAVFLEHGVGRGDIVHFVVGNHNCMFPVIFGAWMIGAVPSLGDKNLETRSIASQLADTDTKLVLCTPETKNLMTEAISINGSHNIQILCLEKSLFEAMNNITDFPEAIDLDTDNDLAVVFWSSGTTSAPKGICHTHASILPFSNILPKLGGTNKPGLFALCFYHVGGFLLPFTALLNNRPVYHAFELENPLESLLQAIIKVQPSSVMLGAHMYVQLSESAILEDTDPSLLDSVRSIGPTGSAVPGTCLRQIEKKFRNLIGCTNAYGSTEVGMCCLSFTQDNLGAVMFPAQLKFVNPETGTLCGPNEVGEICIKTPYMMKGYLNRPEATAKFFDDQGFGHSGDMGYYDENGTVFFVDRRKDIIKYDNNHISPREIEGYLQSHPSVKLCLVYGKKDPRHQELVSAIVVLHEDAKVTEQELVDHVNKNLTPYKHIRGGIEFVEDLPHNSMGKIQRSKIIRD